MKRFLLKLTAMAVVLLFLACPTPNDSVPNNYGIYVELVSFEDGETVESEVLYAKEGDTVTLTAHLNDNRRVSLSSDDVELNPSEISTDEGTITFTMPAANVGITASFSDIPPTLYSITIDQNNSAQQGESVVSEPLSAKEGDTVTLTTSLGIDRRVELSADGIVFDPSVISTHGGTSTFEMPAGNVDISAEFKSLYSISIEQENVAGNSLVSDLSRAAPGDIVTLTANLGQYFLVELSSDDDNISLPASIVYHQADSEKEVTFQMPAHAVEITAAFSEIYPVTLSVTNNHPASESLVSDRAMAQPGEQITLTVSLDDNRCVMIDLLDTIHRINYSDEVKTFSFQMPAEPLNVSADFDSMVQFPDANLERIIRGEIGIPSGEILGSDLLEITELTACYELISSIEGLQYCQELSILDISYNYITDFRPLSGLSNLKELYVWANSTSDLSYLSDLKNLTHLGIGENLSAFKISDISPLRNLSSLEFLDLYETDVSDITPLEDLTDLTELYLSCNKIVDINALSELTNLIELDLSDNEITDIGALSGLKELIKLDLCINHIKDIRPLEVGTMTKLTYLNIFTNAMVIRPGTDQGQANLDVVNGHLNNECIVLWNLGNDVE